MYNLKKILIPTPVQMEDRNAIVKIANISKGDFCFNTKGEGDIFHEAIQHIKKAFLEKMAITEYSGDFLITLEVNDEEPQFHGKTEAYFIDITEDKAVLCASDVAGAYYAAVTFTNLIFCKGGEVYLPQCYIFDYPRFKTRGHFMECRYGSDFMTYEDWKKGIDYLSEMKINKLVCGLYGCWSRQYDGAFAEYLYIPFKKYPELQTPRNIKYYSAKERCMIYKKDILPTMFEEDYFGELIRYGSKKNIEVIPLFNSLGHNTLLPRLFPEISAVDEKGSFSSLGFCTSNEKTYEIMFNIYDEIIDRYLTPNGIDSFEIGLDEVMPLVGVNTDNLQEERKPFCQCPKCRDKQYGTLMIEYIIRIAKHLKQKGINNIYVYHDMLFKNNMLTEETAALFKKEGVYDVIVIDWWSYSNQRERIFHQREDEVNGIFRSVGKPITGYFHWSMPTQMNNNIYIITDISEKNNFEGMVAYSAFEYCYDFNYRVFAECAWRGNEAADVNELMERYAYKMFPEAYSGALTALKLAQEFMLGRYSGTNFATTIFEYYTSSYLIKGMEYPINYPANAFKKLAEDEANLLDYLQKTMLKADAVYKFFVENTASVEGDIWKLIALQYRSICDEFFTIYNCARDYNMGIIDQEAFIVELNRLISNRDKTISLCEDVRIKANQYTTIRNMTVIRQAMCDLRDYMQNEMKSESEQSIDICNFDKYLSSVSYFLR